MRESMPTELIGEFGTPGATSEWIEAEGKLAIAHLKKICGDPPPEMGLEIVWIMSLGNIPLSVWSGKIRCVVCRGITSPDAKQH
jgi:hypothetical protein